MDTDLLKRVKKILKKFKKYWENDKLRRTMVINDLRKYDSTLISELLSDEKIKNLYTTQINGFSVFKIDEIIDILRYKKYFADSYTKYSNEIGLSSEGKYLKYDSDVVLDFPYKDCILEGGMAKEDVGRDEIYYNEIIAKDEIDTLLEPKVFTNVKKYDSEGIHKVMEIEDGDNLIIKGNNLLALYSIKERYKGKIKVIYIDPPYNTGNDSFKYNDRFNHSTWLTFMKNRLEISHKLLNKDGLMWINLDDNEAHYCKVLIDEIFSIDNFIADVIWQSRKSVSNDALISSNTNHILCYAKRKENIDKKIFKLPLDKSKFKYYDEKSDDYYRTEPFDAPNIRNNLTYKILNPNTKEVYLPPQGPD